MSQIPNLPQGAGRIWNMRVGGMKPNEPVFVSTVGPLRDGNFQVLLDTLDRATEYDWRWIVDLSVCLVYDAHVDHKKLSRLAQHMLRHAPNGGYILPFNPNYGCLWLWNTDKQNGSLATFWKGHEGIPLMQIPAEPDSLEVQTMSRLDRATFNGVMPA